MTTIYQIYYWDADLKKVSPIVGNYIDTGIVDGEWGTSLFVSSYPTLEEAEEVSARLKSELGIPTTVRTIYV